MRRKTATLAALLLAMAALTWAAAQATSAPRRRSVPQPDPAYVGAVSIINLIANPNVYHGKTVRVIGYGTLGFEVDAIYFHHDDVHYGISKNALWLSVSKDVRQNAKKYAKKDILVEGTFNARNQGHEGSYSGAIENIQRFEVWAELSGERPPP